MSLILRVIMCHTFRCSQRGLPCLTYSPGIYFLAYALDQKHFLKGTTKFRTHLGALILSLCVKDLFCLVSLLFFQQVCLINNLLKEMLFIVDKQDLQQNSIYTCITSVWAWHFIIFAFILQPKLLFLAHFGCFSHCFFVI